MSEPTKTLVLYHGGCDDGFGGALAAWLALGDSAEYVGLEFGKKPPDVRGREVVMIDFFPYGAEWLRACGAKSMVILDHHQSAAKALQEVCNVRDEVLTFRAEFQGDWLCGETPTQTRVLVVFDMERSGATIAWAYFHPGEPVPEFFRYLEDRDLFRNSLSGNAEFTMALRSYPQEFKVWAKFAEEAETVLGLIAHGVARLIEEGRSINRFYNRKVAEVVATAQRGTVAGYGVPVVSCPWFMGSDVCAILAKGELFACYWYTKGEDLVLGFRSAPDGLDVSEIAKRYGGGGHKHASGAVLKGRGADMLVLGL